MRRKARRSHSLSPARLDPALPELMRGWKRRHPSFARAQSFVACPGYHLSASSSVHQGNGPAPRASESAVDKAVAWAEAAGEAVDTAVVWAGAAGELRRWNALHKPKLESLVLNQLYQLYETPGASVKHGLSLHSTCRAAPFSLWPTSNYTVASCARNAGHNAVTCSSPHD